MLEPMWQDLENKRLMAQARGSSISVNKVDGGKHIDMLMK